MANNVSSRNLRREDSSGRVVPIQVRRALGDHNVSTVQEMGWQGQSNGDLLRNAETSDFELFIIADQNLRYQQNLANRRIAILELWTNHRPTLESHATRIAAAVQTTTPGTYVALGPTS